MALTHGVTHFDPDGCPGCRFKTVGFPANNPTFEPHFNQAVGRWVTSDRDFRDGLKECSERASEDTGIDHDFQPRYPSDMAQVPYPQADGVLDERGRKLAEAMQ